MYFFRWVCSHVESCMKHTTKQVLFIFKALVINYSLQHTCEARPRSPLSRMQETVRKASIGLRVRSVPEGFCGSFPWTPVEFQTSCTYSYTHTHTQSKRRKRKLVGPTFLSEHFSCALHWEEVQSPHTQQNNQTLRGELLPSPPKDNKGSTRNLLAEHEKEQFYSECPSERIFVRTRWNRLVLGYFDFSKSRTFG